jgi:hypothetical protein
MGIYPIPEDVQGTSQDSRNTESNPYVGLTIVVVKPRNRGCICMVSGLLNNVQGFRRCKWPARMQCNGGTAVVSSRDRMLLRESGVVYTCVVAQDGG